jgi:hypothetical protein
LAPENHNSSEQVPCLSLLLTFIVLVFSKQNLVDIQVYALDQRFSQVKHFQIAKFLPYSIPDSQYNSEGLVYRGIFLSVVCFLSGIIVGKLWVFRTA